MREGKRVIENEPKYLTAVYMTDREYGCRKQALASYC